MRISFYGKDGSIAQRRLRAILIFLVALVAMQTLQAKGEVIDSVTLHITMYVPERTNVGFDDSGVPMLDTNARGMVEMTSYTADDGSGHEIILIEHK